MFDIIVHLRDAENMLRKDAQAWRQPEDLMGI